MVATKPVTEAVERNALPSALHAEAVRSLHATVLGWSCPCGASKSEGRPFCELCADRLVRAGFGNQLYNIAHYARHHQVHFEAGFWKHYDRMMDVCCALRSGRWDGRRAKRGAAE